MISVVVCSIDPAKLERVARNYALRLRGEEYEFIGIRDAKSLCEGYSRGFRLSKGSVIIFSHDDIEILSSDFVGKLNAALQTHDLVGVAGTTKMMDALWGRAGQPHVHGLVVYPPVADPGEGYHVNVFGAEAPVISDIQALDGLFFAAKREVVDRVGFDEQTFDAFHGYDVDFTFSAYLAGFRLAISAEIIIAHASPGHFNAEWAKYNQRFVEKYKGRLSGGQPGSTRIGVARFSKLESVMRACELANVIDITKKIRNKGGQ